MGIYNIFELLGGLGLFIYGMQMLGDGLEKAAGNKLKVVIEKLTTNKFMGFLVGCLVTFVIQSSSATTVMVVGFVNAGLMNLSQAVGVVLGANVGTTITGQLIAFKLTAVAPVFALIGLLMMIAGKRNEKLYNYGYVALGFAILFVGMNLMSDSMKPLAGNETFSRMMVSFENPFLGILIGLLITSIIQSSSVSIGMLIAVAMSGLTTLDSSIYLIMGMNIGTCITAMIASIGSDTDAKRVSTIHLLQKIMATAIFLILSTFIPFAKIVSGWTPGDVSRQIANFHTLFNVVGVIFLLPISSFTIKLSKMIIKDKPETPEERERKLQYIDDNMLKTPVIAQSQLYKEVDRMGRIAANNFHDAAQSLLRHDLTLEDKIMRSESTIDYLTDQTTAFIVKVQTSSSLNTREEEEMVRLYHVIIDIERIGDYAENVIEYTQKMKREGVGFSGQALDELSEIFKQVETTFSYALDAFATKDEDLMQRAMESEERVDMLIEQSINKHVERMAMQKCTPQKGVIFTNLLNDLERVSDHAQNIALAIKLKTTKEIDELSSNINA